jgi:hypothetical protein
MKNSAACAFRLRRITIDRFGFVLVRDYGVQVVIARIFRERAASFVVLPPGEKAMTQFGINSGKSRQAPLAHQT